MSENQTSTGGLNRRSVVKGAAWSVPVIAAAIAAPAASASVLGADLTPAFGGTQVLRLRVGTGPLTANIDATLANTLTITNIGGLPSAAGTTVTVTYPTTLGSGVTLVPGTGGLATVTTAPGGFLITLPAIPAGGSVTFNLGLVSLPVGILAGPQTITATVNAADANPANNTASTTVGITIVGAGA